MQTCWNAKVDMLFIDLLYNISRDVGYGFDKVQIKNACYRPISHGNVENENNVIRENLAKIVSGEKSLNMNVTGFPINDEFAKSQLSLHQKMSDDSKEETRQSPLRSWTESSRPRNFCCTTASTHAGVVLSFDTQIHEFLTTKPFHPLSPSPNFPRLIAAPLTGRGQRQRNI